MQVITKHESAVKGDYLDLRIWQKHVLLGLGLEIYLIIGFEDMFFVCFFDISFFLDVFKSVKEVNFNISHYTGLSEALTCSV